MHSTCVIVLLSLLLLLPWHDHAQALDPVPQANYVWSIHDLVPGSNTFFLDINDDGDIVGYVRGADNIPHAFLLSNFSVLSLVCPTPAATQLAAINGRRIVGGTCLAPTPPLAGRKSFLSSPVRERRPPTLSFIGSAEDIANPMVDIELRGLNDWGHAVGAWSDHRGGMFEGFLSWSSGPSGAFWRIKAVVPERPVFNTWFNGVNNAINIVGAYAERPSFPLHGLFYANNTFMTHDVPGATNTSWWDLNDRVEIVGTAEDSTGPFSVLYTSSPIAFWRLDYPDPAVLFTDVTGINNAGVLVGMVLLPHPDEPGGVVFKGFVASPKPATFGTSPAALALTSHAIPAVEAAHIAPHTRVTLNWETCTTTADAVLPLKMRSMVGCD